LFVDDEPILIEVGGKMLSRAGYQVETRASSIEALKLFEEDPNRFDLVITDMTMPHLTGDQLARKMIELRPDIPIILCTGYSELVDESRAEQIGIKAFVMKPLVASEITGAIRKVLDAK
jgi:two-component system cell cycle sensor histidine kinase/response regulator CckA